MCDPLEADHAELVRAALPVCDKYGLALAGGYAMKAHGLVSRASKDIDFATASTAAVQEIAHDLATAYGEAGLAATVIAAQDRKGHLLVRLPQGSEYRVDILKEPLSGPPAIMSFGPVLSLEDAVSLKMGALHDRGLPRDLIDVHAATMFFSNIELVSMAKRALGDDFFYEDLRDQLDHAAVYSDEEFTVYGCREDQITAIKAWAQQWADHLGRLIAQETPYSDELD
ncbi:hypothetical protein Sru01_50600 [Sphaerisporangium rufum]|uniref:Nucleotidyl transferase AbiEii/AbiGii toxin family protein n=1 Tax=Sphaerisporangium rufum TaxID=1381558 RepID=A0A919R6L0_9ACTN|nr:nucleotidyl transferase AbiEii/AbiGii toxin family protein [Sphaerisporangium rufum]GII80078.1 hypothetical protein Sru01_50600 [Sphaerisporangium rufum]